MSARAESGRGSRSGQVPYKRLPYPIGFCWVRAQQATQPSVVYKSAEVVVRVMSALVLADVLDLDWPEPVEKKLRDGLDSKGLEKLAFGRE
jgi:hypothetical protein